MALPDSITDRNMQSFVESSTVANKPVRAVANPDGTAVFGTLIAGEDLTNNVLGTQRKPVASSIYSGIAFNAVETASVAISVKATAGNLLSVIVTNYNAALRYLQIHNKASAPANPNVPVISIPIPAGTATAPGKLELSTAFFGDGGYFLSTGVAVGVSTTGGTYTAATAADHVIAGFYV